MTLQITNRSNFINDFLTPLSKINNTCILKVDKDRIFSLISATDNTVVVYGKYEIQTDVEDSICLNIPDLMRLIKILYCINTEEIDLEIHSNHIKYTSPDIRFTYHLLEDGILTLPPLSVEKIKNLSFSTSFKAPYSSFVDLIKGSTFALNISKVYFFTKDGAMYVELTDKQTSNVDSMCIKLCNKYTGTDINDPLPVGLETVRTFVGSKCDFISGKINPELNVMSFEINNNNTHITYIVSGLIK